MRRADSLTSEGDFFLSTARAAGAQSVLFPVMAGEISGQLRIQILIAKAENTLQGLSHALAAAEGAKKIGELVL